MKSKKEMDIYAAAGGLIFVRFQELTENETNKSDKEKEEWEFNA